MVIEQVQLLEKKGGKSGHYQHDSQSSNPSESK